MKNQKLPNYNKEVEKKPNHLVIKKTNSTKIKEVDETFSLLIKEENGQKKVKIIIGNNLASKKVFSNEKAAINYINQKPYELIGTLVILIMKAREEMSNNKNNKK